MKNKKSILWCITGSGYLLKETIDTINKIRNSFLVTVALSNAGEEVIRMYGLESRLFSLSHEIIFEREQGFSSPIVGRLYRGDYSKVVVAPCSANTTAKIVYGIADSLITNIVAQSLKAGIDVLVLPTDIKPKVKTRVPIFINYEKCQGCETCSAIEACSKNAIYIGIQGKPRINLLKCDGCKLCLTRCKAKAIEFGKVVEINTREIDRENASKLAKIKGIKVFLDYEELELL